jgi:hypothetical protein
MITKKNYRVCVSFGDGQPVTIEVTAKSGHEAISLAHSLHPGSRNVHLLGTTDVRVEQIHPLFVETVNEESAPIDDVKDRQISLCAQMRSEGKTHAEIAGFLDVGKTTVGRWLKRYG